MKINQKEINIINERPPIWEKAHQRFEIDDSRTIYAYGTNIYNPAGVNVTPELLEHESVHMHQQDKHGGPEAWWKRYLDDEVFRMEMELEAYGRQYWYYCREVTGDRNKRLRYLFLLASIMLSPMYKIDREYTGDHENVRMQIIKWANKQQ